MIQTAEINNSMPKLKTFIESCGFLKDETVEIDLEDSAFDSYTGMTVLKILDKDGNVLFRIEEVVVDGQHRGRWAAYASSSLKTINTSTNVRQIVNAAGCPNGLSIYTTISDFDHAGHIRIVRNNLGALTFIYPVGGNSGQEEGTDLACITWGDISPLRTITVAGNTRMQRLVMPMFTNAAFDTLSYTDHAGIMPYNDSYTNEFKAVTINGHRWLTDGFFAIEDEG